MRTSSRPSRPFGLCIGGNSVEGSNLGQIGGGSYCPAIVVDRVPLEGPPSPHGKGKVRPVRSGILVTIPT